LLLLLCAFATPRSNGSALFNLYPRPGADLDEDVLEIKTLRHLLNVRDSPFVQDNNAGGGFGESGCRRRRVAGGGGASDGGGGGGGAVAGAVA
jgi:uncharacterized membrane protein YgcG